MAYTGYQKCKYCYWWKEHKQCMKTLATDTCEDYKHYDETCGNCKHYRKHKKCLDVAEWDTCDRFESKSPDESCKNCRLFGKKRCPKRSRDPHGTCESFTPARVKTDDEIIDEILLADEPDTKKPVPRKTRDDDDEEETALAPMDRSQLANHSTIKKMIHSGMRPDEMAKALGVQLNSTENIENLNRSPDAILKQGLHTALGLLQLAELNYKKSDGKATQLQALNMTLGTVRDLVKDLQTFQDPVKFYYQLEENLIQEAAKRYLQVLTTEIDELRRKTNELVPEHKRSVVNKVFIDFFNGVSTSLRGQYLDLRKELAILLGVQNRIEELDMDGRPGGQE